MVSINVDIGNKDDSLTAAEILSLEKEFRNERMPQLKTEQFITEHMGDKKSAKCPVALSFDDVTICIGSNLDVLMNNDDPDKMSTLLEKTVIPRMKKIFPEKDLKPGQYWKIEEFDRMNRPRGSMTTSDTTKKRSTLRHPVVLGAVLGAIITGIAFIIAAVIGLFGKGHP